MAETIASPGAVPITILSQGEYFYDLKQNISKAGSGDRISITFMAFEPTESTTQELVEGLQTASAHGASTTFCFDAYSFMVTDGETYVPGPMFLPLPFGQQPFHQRQEVYDRLTIHGNINAAVLNVPKHILSNPFGGRSHIKLAAINDIAYVAGPNLYAWEDREDMIFRTEDAVLSAVVHKIIQRLLDTRNTQEAFNNTDQRIPIDIKTDLLIDAGTPSSSLIMDTALETIARAQEWIVLGSQFFPTSEITQGLRTAAYQRGVDVHIVRNRPMTQKSLKKAWQLASLLRGRLVLPSSFFRDQIPQHVPSSHVAVLVSEHEVIKGSHNFHAAGVRMGTAEAAIHRRNDPALAKAVARRLFRQTGLPDRFG